MLRSFRIQVALLFGAIAMVLVLVLTTMTNKLLVTQVTQDQGEALQALARSTSAMLAEGLHERLREIDLLAASPDITQGGTSPDRIGQVLDRVQRTRPQYSWIGLASVDGIVRVATQSMLIGKDVHERPWFQHAQQSAFVGDVHDAKLLAKMLPPSETGEPQRFVDFAAPVKAPDGKVTGILGAHANWDWVRSVVQTLRSDRVRNKGVLIFVLDAHGKVIHKPLGPEGQIAPLPESPLPADHGIVPWSDGAHYLTATARLNHSDTRTQLGWTIVVRQPEALALRAAFEVRKTMLLIGGVATLLAMSLAWYAAKRLSTPLQRISQAAKRIEAGELNAHLPDADGSSELHDLSDSLRGMTDSLLHHQHALEEANTTLEERVRERTDELQRANAELVILARKDALTGLFNRRAAEDRMQEESVRNRRNKRVTSLVMVDIDYFKRVNDEFGHAAGDEALKSVAHCLGRHCRGSDFIARFGGEEFLILLSETPLAGAMHVAEKLRQSVSALQVPGVGQVTISMGVAQSNEDGSGPLQDVLKAADEALYSAKERGRNRVVAYGQIEAETSLAH